MILLRSREGQQQKGEQMFDSTLYVCQLPTNAQRWIYGTVKRHLIKEGHTTDVIKECLENVMAERVCNISHVIDMDKLERRING